MTVRRTHSIAALLASAGVLAALAGCASTSDDAERAALTALATPVAKTPATAAPSGPSDVRCGDPTASLRPPRTLPAPGRMPAGSFMRRIQKRGRLIAGVDQNTLLFGYLRPSTGRIEGFEVDLLRRLAQALFGDPNRIELRALTTAERLPAVESGAVDVVADAVTVTCERRRDVAFSTVYYQAAQRVLVPSSSRARGLAELGGRRVCATTGSTTLQRIERDPARPIPYPVARRTDCLVALQEGRVDAISSDDAILLGFRAQDPDTKIVGPRLAPEPYGMAIAKGHPEFVRFVNGVLDGMRTDGGWAAIHRRWLGRLTPTPAPPRPHYRG
jgi:polar amino acid transport system substrate-binding protein